MARIKGYTLVELLIVIILSGLVVLISFNVYEYSNLLIQKEINSLQKVEDLSNFSYQIEYEVFHCDRMITHGEELVDSLEFQGPGKRRSVLDFTSADGIIWNGIILMGLESAPGSFEVGYTDDSEIVVNVVGFHLFQNDDKIPFHLYKSYSSSQLLSILDGSK